MKSPWNTLVWSSVSSSKTNILYTSSLTFTHVHSFIVPWVSLVLKCQALRIQSWVRDGPCFWKVYCVVQSIDGETVETVLDFILGGSKITGDGDCSHEIKRRLLLGRKVMTNLDSILKSRDITLPTKVHLVKAMVFPVVMYGFESWTIKKLSAKELMLWNCGVGEDSWESLGLQGDPITQS